MELNDDELARAKKIARANPVRRGTHKRRAKALGMHMSTFWQQSDADRKILYELSKKGRRQQ